MSLRQFWTSIRTGAGFLWPTATADSPKLDANRIKAKLHGASTWLTPRSVEGFDIRDFDFLTEKERDRLAQCVDQFKEAAQQMAPNQPATNEQVQAALPPFLCVLEIIRPDKYGDLEAFVIGKKVENELASLPDWVKELRFETGEDANGDPAMWVWVEIDDTAADKEVFSQNTKKIKEAIESRVRNLGVQQWPYVRFRTSSEQEFTAAEDAE